MASSSQVRLAYIKNATAGTTPATGNFNIIRFNDESLTNTPVFQQSGETRSDRQPSQNVLIGSDPGGTINFDWSPTVWLTDWVEAAMMSSWSAKLDSGALTIAVSATGKTLTRSTGSFASAGFASGDLVELQGYSATANNTMVYISGVTGAVITFIGPSDITTSAGSGDEHVVRHAYCDIGTTQEQISVEKQHLDLTLKSHTYLLYPNSFSMSCQGRNRVTGSIQTVGTYHATPSACLTTGRTVNAVATEQVLDGSNNLDLLIVDGESPSYCVGGVDLTYNNNHTPRICVNSSFPSAYESGEASVQLNLRAYLVDGNFALHSKRDAGTPIAVHWGVYNASKEGYAFSVPQLKLNFPDSNSPGKNQGVMINAQGTGEVDSTVGSALRVYHVTQS